jgi:hypothetical protein
MTRPLKPPRHVYGGLDIDQLIIHKCGGEPYVARGEPRDAESPQHARIEDPMPGIAPAPTSEAAADHMKRSGKAANRRQWVLAEILQAGNRGRTNFELVELYGGAQYQTGIQPRTTELVGLGKIKDSGRTRRRPGSNLGSIVWIATTREEEAAILEAAKRRRQRMQTQPSREAEEAAAALSADAKLGGLFSSEDHFARAIQAAIDKAIEGRRGKA